MEAEERQRPGNRAVNYSVIQGMDGRPTQSHDARFSCLPHERRARVWNVAAIGPLLWQMPSRRFVKNPGCNISYGRGASRCR